MEELDSTHGHMQAAVIKCPTTAKIIKSLYKTPLSLPPSGTGT